MSSQSHRAPETAAPSRAPSAAQGRQAPSLESFSSANAVDHQAGLGNAGVQGMAGIGSEGAGADELLSAMMGSGEGDWAYLDGDLVDAIGETEIDIDAALDAGYGTDLSQMRSDLMVDYEALLASFEEDRALMRADADAADAALAAGEDESGLIETLVDRLINIGHSLGEADAYQAYAAYTASMELPESAFAVKEGVDALRVFSDTNGRLHANYEQQQKEIAVMKQASADLVEFGVQVGLSEMLDALEAAALEASVATGVFAPLVALLVNKVASMTGDALDDALGLDPDAGETFAQDMGGKAVEVTKSVSEWFAKESPKGPGDGNVANRINKVAGLIGDYEEPAKIFAILYEAGTRYDALVTQAEPLVAARDEARDGVRQLGPAMTQLVADLLPMFADLKALEAAIVAAHQTSAR